MSETELLNRSADEVLHVLERHRGLLRRLGQGDRERALTCLRPDCPHRRKLRETLRETVEVLEGTRRAFKSKQLEALRKKLIGVLADDA